MTVCYVVLIEKLGFFLCTAHLPGRVHVGRPLPARAASSSRPSLIGSLVFMFMFMKVVYVSLPLGVGPVRAGLVRC